jgi:DNA-binding NtrC family response regulator
MQEKPVLLFIDDHPELLRLITFILQKSEFSIMSTSSATEALEIILHKESIFMILSDYDMPGIKGTKLLWHAKQHRPSALRVLTSGGLDEGATNELIRNGICEYFLPKPWQISHLREIILNGFNLYKNRKTNI